MRLSCYLICIRYIARFPSGFFVEIEALIAGYEMPENADIDNIQSAANLTFDIILNVLYNGKSEEYKTMIATIKDGRKHEV